MGVPIGERIRNVGGALVLSAALVGCSPSPRPRDRSQPTPIVQTDEGITAAEFETWPVVRIPGDSGRLTYFSAENVQSEEIGVTDIYIIPNDVYPAVAIGAVFGSQSKSSRESRFRLSGKIGFQKLTGPLFVAVEKVESASLDFLMPPQEALQFGYETLKNIDMLQGGKLGRRELPYVIDGRFRPDSSDPYVIVFERAVIEYKGQPSKKSYLRVRVFFDQYQPPNIPTQKRI